MGKLFFFSIFIGVACCLLFLFLEKLHEVFVHLSNHFLHGMAALLFKQQGIS